MQAPSVSTSVVRKFTRFLLRVGIALGTVYLALLVVLYCWQGRLIYVSRTASEEYLLRQATEVQLQPWRDAHGSLIGWTRPNPGAANRALVFHGSAGWALYRSHFADALEQIDGGRDWEVYVLEYPGFGSRPGPPSEEALVGAATSASESLLVADRRPLYLFGESLGSGSACAVAGKLGQQIAGVALIVPYQSLADAAGHLYPYVPVKLLLKDRYDNVAALKKYHGPVAFALAEKDEIVTFAGGKALYEQYSGPKFLKVFPGIGHNQVNYSPWAPWWKEFSDFLRSTH